MSEDVDRECPMGLTNDEVIAAVADIDHFYQWMTGQTMGVCDGRLYDYDAKEYRPTSCAANPHGGVVYRSDLHRYLDGLPVID